MGASRVSIFKMPALKVASHILRLKKQSEKFLHKKQLRSGIHVLLLNFHSFIPKALRCRQRPESGLVTFRMLTATLMMQTAITKTVIGQKSFYVHLIHHPANIHVFQYPVGVAFNTHLNALDNLMIPACDIRLFKLEVSDPLYPHLL